MRRWLILLLVLLTACDAQPRFIPTPTPFVATTTPTSLRLAAPGTLVPAMQALAAAYRQVDPTVQITVLERADSLAWDALRRGDVDLAALTWMPAEATADVWSAVFARDGLAIVVNPQNGITGMTADQVRLLFQGRAEDWSPWGGLPGTPAIISREEASGAYACFQSRMMKSARVTLTALLAPTAEAVLQQVGQEPLAVGYISTARLDGRVRPVAVDGIPPTPETIAAALYPLTRDLRLTALGEPRGAAREFAQWMLGPAGQKVLAARGYVTRR